ncbi:alcohol dehydrogenase catalytic domain-containing protein [Occultella aeris]|uniref:L-threonine 3-dehydrogenase n=1 Tax=Occultella aeris TaxID=2761496 RepID=A0A7M4DQE9_9MICO|nr:alcohol dehydrogenase catalytic domain-containing protein [Occultella aeris]VZO39693.1 L-threonine 3-dehydrogenase [Occultella aeris]
MSITAPAPHFDGAGRIRVADHFYRDPGPGELRIRIGANAICGTDRKEYTQGVEIVPGHEAAGVVESAGPGTTLPIGTRGAIYLMDFCGECRSCSVGATNQCSAKRQDVGQTSDGGYGPYAIVHETNFFPVTEDVSLVAATMLLDVMGTSTHALGRAELVRPDTQSVLVVGAGPIGLGLAAMAKVRYGHDFPVYVSDISEFRLDLAARLGARPVDARDEASILALRPDIAFDSSGKTVARETALRSLGQRGALICVGHGEGLGIDVSRDLIAPERAVLGSEYFRFDEMPENLQALRDNLDYLSSIVTHTVDVAELPAAFELFLSGRTGKVVVTQEVTP